MEAIWLVILFLAACFLAYANGANDNFKGVATLFGSRTTNYRTALGWATITTFAGSVCSVMFARALIKTFSGKGLVPANVVASPDFALAVAIGAGFTVMLATLTGFPISTTHSLTGALVGSGFVAVGLDVNFGALGKSFFLPLLASPLIAMCGGAIAYGLFRWIPGVLGIKRQWVDCEPTDLAPAPTGNPGPKTADPESTTPDDDREARVEQIQRYEGCVLGVSAQRIVDAAHYLSAGTVSFARGLNDTPKIVALLLVADAVGVRSAMLAVGLAMAVGGLINARRVAETMSHKITPMTHGQGFSANLVTGALVVFASRLGVPVSTTHVSCGSLFGIGLINRSANTRVVSEIVVSWVLTLPIGALAAALAHYLLTMT